jgi:hypothetical protein
VAASYKAREEEAKLGQISITQLKTDSLSFFSLSLLLGTTWTVEMVYLIVNNLDYELAISKTQEERMPFIE